MDQWLINTIRKLQTSNDLADIKHVLVKIRKHLGFDNIVYTVKIPETFTKSSLLSIGDYPDEWMERYGKQGYINIDPVVLHCSHLQTPYFWTRFDEHPEGSVRQFVGEAAEFGLCDGISIGMPRFDGKTGVINLSSDHKVDLSAEQCCQIVAYLNALQPCIHERICHVIEHARRNSVMPHLTKREKTCLLWVAEGKTANDIATILAISESTVVFHLKNAIQKLDVTNRSQAIAKAVLLGLITPQFLSGSVPSYHF